MKSGSLEKSPGSSGLPVSGQSSLKDPPAQGPGDANIYSSVSKTPASAVVHDTGDAEKPSLETTAAAGGASKRAGGAASSSSLNQPGKKLSSESRIPRRVGEAAESTNSPARRKELQEKLARLNSRYVAGLGGSLVAAAAAPEAAGKVGLAALQDIAARQEAALAAALDDVTTPTNNEASSVLRYDPVSNKMSLTAASASLPASPQRLPASRCVPITPQQKFREFCSGFVIFSLFSGSYLPVSKCHICDHSS
jgi:hypothetical protein